MTIYRAAQRALAELGLTEDDVLDSTEANWDKEIQPGLAFWTREWVCIAAIAGPVETWGVHFQCVRRNPPPADQQIPPVIRVHVDS